MQRTERIELEKRTQTRLYNAVLHLQGVEEGEEGVAGEEAVVGGGGGSVVNEGGVGSQKTQEGGLVQVANDTQPPTTLTCLLLFAYNRAGYLTRTLKSLEAVLQDRSTYPGLGNVEVVISQDGDESVPVHEAIGMVILNIGYKLYI